MVNEHQCICLSLLQVTAPVPLKGSSLELCKKAFARQRAKDLTEQASALLAKDKQIEALQQECRELQAKLSAGKVRLSGTSLSGWGQVTTVMGTRLQGS